MSKHFKPMPPQTDAEVRAEHDATWAEFMSKVRRAHQQQNITAAEILSINRLAGLDGGPPLALASIAHANRAVYESVHYQLTAISDCDETLELLHVTVALNTWTTSDEMTVLRLGDLKRNARPILTALAPNWVARIEMQSVTNIRHRDGGRTVCPHVHAWLWGHNIAASARANAAALNRKFTATYPGRWPSKSIQFARPASIFCAWFVTPARHPTGMPRFTFTLRPAARTPINQRLATDSSAICDNFKFCRCLRLIA
jgi:hypothetical protein